MNIFSEKKEKKICLLFVIATCFIFPIFRMLFEEFETIMYGMAKIEVYHDAISFVDSCVSVFVIAIFSCLIVFIGLLFKKHNYYKLNLGISGVLLLLGILGLVFIYIKMMTYLPVYSDYAINEVVSFREMSLSYYIGIFIMLIADVWWIKAIIDDCFSIRKQIILFLAICVIASVLICLRNSYTDSNMISIEYIGVSLTIIITSVVLKVNDNHKKKQQTR